ncbi:hypothetical protein GW17_00059087 [Ensete ventricosum]|nr:hypothetical protein GW17_00059087 [Ensete ventricosum]
MHRVDVFGNSSGVCRKLTEGIGSLPGWRKGVRQKKTETWQKIIRGDSPKESESSLGSQREIAGKKTGGLAVRLLEVAGVCGIKLEFEKWREPLLRKFRWVNRWRATVGSLVPQNPGGGQQLSVGKPPRWRVNSPYHRI